MSTFTDVNFQNIVNRFERKTGVRLYPKRNYKIRTLPKFAILAATVAVFALLAAFAYPLFSPLNGDALELEATYRGNGNVSIYVNNRSDRVLELQPQVKLFKWITGEEVPQLSGDIVFDELTFPANSEGTLHLDLSQAYDIEMLEQSLISEWYYLVLTNQNFVFGQQWKCSIYFGQEDPYQEESGEPLYSIDPRILSQVEEDLRYYFEDDFIGFLAANPLHYDYLQKAQELLLRQEKRAVEAVDTDLMVHLVEEEPLFGSESTGLSTGQRPTVQDAFGKLVGSTTYEHVNCVSTYLPASAAGEDESYQVPLLYFSAFETASVSEDTCTLIYGQILTFDELEPYMVYQNDEYTYYNVTHLFYTDLDSYMENIIEYRKATKQNYYYDEDLARQLETMYNYYTENLEIITWEEFRQLRGICNTRELPEREDLATKGISGQIVSDFDVLEVTFTVTSNEDEQKYRITYVPESTDSPWGAYGCELSEAMEINKLLPTLQPGEYTFAMDVLLDTDYHPKRGLWECIFTVSE